MPNLLTWFGTIFVVALVSTATGTVAKTIPVVDYEKSGRIAMAAPPVDADAEACTFLAALCKQMGIDGIYAVDVGIPGHVGKDFTLRAISGKPGPSGFIDFDVVFRDSAGTAVGSSGRPGDESGTIPLGTSKATVYLVDGQDARFYFSISHQEDI